MSIQNAIRELAAMGPFPPETTATAEELDQRQQWLEQIVRPISDEDAQVLVTLFGPDDCFGGAWTLLHLIETAPSALTATYLANRDNEWVKTLEARRSSQSRPTQQ